MSDTKTDSGLIKFETFLRRIGVSTATGFRWRQSGKLNPTINIDGRLYLKREEAEEFERRAKAGEFAKRLKKPSRKP